MLAMINQIEVDRQRVFNQIGYADDSQPSARIDSLVNDYIENYHDLLAPSYSYTIKNIKAIEGNSVTIEDSIKFESKVIVRLLSQCEKVAVFALTIGNHLEEMVSHLADDGLILQATVLDAVGSGAAEKLAGFVEDKIKSFASSQGLRASRRFSPGYCDWKISQQKLVFQALGSDSAGVVLTERFLMIPQKSVSGIIGLSKGNIEDYNPCHTCKKLKCPGRR